MSQTSNQESRSPNDRVSERNEKTHRHYYDDTTDHIQQIDQEIEDLEKKRAALKRLDKKVAKIDRDLGSGTVEIDGNLIQVKTATPDHAEEVKALIHDYSWPKKYKIGYDTRSRCITWSMETHIETLVEDHQRIVATQTEDNKSEGGF